jgi:hypothetical protein
MATAERIKSATMFAEWLRVAVHEENLPANDRVRAAGSCFAIAQEHHFAIVYLVERGRYASSFSLLRIAFEAYVRGLWLSRCAKDVQCRKFLRGWEPPKIDSLLQKIEQEPGFSEQVLSSIKRRSWKAMCAYTHTGGLHVQRWNTSESIEPSYSAEEVSEVLTLAELVGAMSVIAVAELAQNDELALRVLGGVKAHAKNAL